MITEQQLAEINTALAEANALRDGEKPATGTPDVSLMAETLRFSASMRAATDTLPRSVLRFVWEELHDVMEALRVAMDEADAQDEDAEEAEEGANE